MEIHLIVVGKTDTSYLKEAFEVYHKRLNFYVRFNFTVIPDLKSAPGRSEEEQKKQEGKLISDKIQPNDYMVLLDDKGNEQTSLRFADWLQKRMSAGTKRLCFVIGGPYGFSAEIQERADTKISLSKMTFSHQLVRVIFAEQLYRAFTIIHHEPYHHE